MAHDGEAASHSRRHGATFTCSSLRLRSRGVERVNQTSIEFNSHEFSSANIRIMTLNQQFPSEACHLHFPSSPPVSEL